MWEANGIVSLRFTKETNSKARKDSGERGCSLFSRYGWITDTLVQRQVLISAEHSAGHLQLGGVPKGDV